MQAKDLILQIAVEMGKPPASFDKFIKKLEDEMLDTVDDIRNLSDADWNSLQFPLGLVNKIKQKLSEGSMPVKSV